MPIYDPAIRGSSTTFSTGGTSTAPVPKPTGTVDGDFVLVVGIVGGAGQINAPDVSWTRVNGVAANYQAFWKRASGEPANWTFSWDGVNRAYIFDAFSVFSQAGGTISLNLAAMSFVGSATSKTSDAITPGADALVLVDFIEFASSEPGPPVGPSGLTLIRNNGGAGSPSNYSGYIYITSGHNSGTFITSNNAGDPNTNFYWGSGTFALVSSVASIIAPLLTDEAIFTPSIRAIPDVVFCGATTQVGFPFWSGSGLTFTPPAGLLVGDLMIAHIWSDGTAPGQNAFLGTPPGWTFLQGSYLENFARLPPSANWIFYRIATTDDLKPGVTYVWLAPRPTLNIWTGILYAFCNVDPVNPFNGFKTLTGFGSDPKAPSLSPDWRNDVSLLLFAQIDPPGTGPWPLKPDAPAGYVQLAKMQNQGDWQIGYLGVPNSCSPVPDVFAYTSAQQTAAFGGVPIVTAWFAYSFLLKNINVSGQICAISGGGPGPGPPPPAGPPNPIAPLNFPLCPLPGGISGIPLEIQTPAKLLDNGRLGLCSRFFIDINTNNEQLTLTILVDNAEYVYPILVQTANRRTFEAQFQVSGRIYSIRLAGCLSFGRVEFFEAWTDLDEGRPPEVQTQQ